MPRPVLPNADALAGELLGAPIHVVRATGFSPLPFDGTLVDETMGTFLIRPDAGGRPRRLQKTGLEATILLGAGEIPLKGDTLRVRPEDRTKRLSPRGRRS
jgi:RNase P/RNase MRP subunit p29